MAEEKVGWEQTKAIWANKETRLIYKLLGGIVLIGLGVLVGRLIYAAPEANQAWSYGVNLFTGVISTAATVLILDQLTERRADRKAEEALKREWIEDAASTSNEIAKNAITRLKRNGLLKSANGLLKGVNLNGANLQSAGLFAANLQATHLFAANLQEADMRSANLQRADLNNANLCRAGLRDASLCNAEIMWANLQEAHLKGANLKGANLQASSLARADLSYTNLQSANLRNTDLRGADLVEANLEGAIIVTELWGRTEFDESTILPHGFPWTSETDMHQFTDPKHPDFWRLTAWRDSGKSEK